MSTVAEQDNHWYPDDPLDAVSPSRRAHVESELATLAPLVPTTPGRYLDREDSPWTLTADGQWYDEDGVTRPKAWNPLLALIGLHPAAPHIGEA